MSRTFHCTYPSIRSSVVDSDPHFLAVLDPDPYWECGSGPGAWIQNKPGILAFLKARVPSNVCFFYLLPTLSVFLMLKFNFSLL
jgi:hypothetical protein